MEIERVVGIDRSVQLHDEAQRHAACATRELRRERQLHRVQPRREAAQLAAELVAQEGARRLHGEA